MSGITFDPSISLSAIVSLVSMVGVAFVAAIKMRDFARDVAREVRTLKNDVGQLGEAVEQIRVIQLRLSDGKERMDHLEGRIHDVEIEVAKQSGHRKI